MHHDAVQSMSSLLPLIAPLDPGFHLGVFVGGVIVGNHMEGQIWSVSWSSCFRKASHYRCVCLADV